MDPRVSAAAVALATLVTARGALAQTVVADCAPDTVVAAATGARQAILQRARTYHDLAPDYQQANCVNFGTGAVEPNVGGGCTAPTWYRTDCSGFVSAAWSLDSSLDTAELGYAGTRGSQTWAQKPWSALQPGDAINLPHGHTAIFSGWLDAAETQFCVFEEVHAAYTDPWGGLGCIADNHSAAEYQALHFVPIGLVGIDADGGLDGSAPAGDGGSLDGAVGEVLGLGALPAAGARADTAATTGCATGSGALPVEGVGWLTGLCTLAGGVWARGRARARSRRGTRPSRGG